MRHWEPYSNLKKSSFECEGLDLSQEMLDIAKQKVDVIFHQKDISNFNLNKRYDAIICMFATFNHLTTIDYAIKALFCFYQHLNPSGILLIDLHNPQSNGSKVDEFDKIKRIMSWSYDRISKMERTKIKFIVPEGIIKDEHLLRIYSIEGIKKLLENAGFKKISAYEGYGFSPAKESSKNLEIIGIKNTKKLKGGSFK